MSNKTEKFQDPTMNQSSAYFLHPTDTGLKIVSNLFSGVGFKGWKRVVIIALTGKNKIGFVDGSIKRSSSNAALGKAWDRVNNIVIGWLLNAMDEKISKSFLYFQTAREIWEELEQRFGQSTSAQLFTVEEQISKAIQTPEMSIEDFFTRMKSLWDEVDALDPGVICSCKGCECDVSKKALQSQQRRRMIQFLMKLDGKYQQTRSSILIMKDLPTVSEAYRILIQEQTHQEISKITHTIEQDTSMACRVEKRKNYDNKYKKNEKYASGSKKSNTTLFCENCNIHGHTIDRCWKVHGYPQGFKNNSWKKDGTVGMTMGRTRLGLSTLQLCSE